MPKLNSNRRKILILGAGQSASILIEYLLEVSDKEKLHITVADISKEQAFLKTKNHKNSTAIALNVKDEALTNTVISESTMVISMLPAKMHLAVAKACLHFGKPMVTPSYSTKEMEALNEEAIKKKVLILNEIGLDPGIDHMSAVSHLDSIRDKGGKILLFESFTGGLIAPESETNLWQYKFTWNPRNVILAGQGGVSKFIQEGKYKYIPYHKLFRRTEILTIENVGKFEAYPNRDSLKYQEVYGLNSVDTIYRGTLRRVGFSRAWNLFVQLGMTDDSYTIDNSETMSYRDFTNLFLAYNPTDSVELKLRHYLKIDQDDVVWEKLLELELFNPSKKIGIKNASPAQILEKIVREKWSLKEDDKDRVIMLHLIGYELEGKKELLKSSMVCVGENTTKTAMAKTVGLPIAFAAIKILNSEITLTGVRLPIHHQIYKPILEELKKHKIEFNTTKIPFYNYNSENVNG